MVILKFAIEVQLMLNMVLNLIYILLPNCFSGSTNTIGINCTSPAFQLGFYLFHLKTLKMKYINFQPMVNHQQTDEEILNDHILEATMNLIDLIVDKEQTRIRA